RYGFLMDAAVLANVECGHVEAEDAGASHDAAEKSALYVRPEPALDQAITDELQIGQEVAAAIGPRTVSIDQRDRRRTVRKLRRGFRSKTIHSSHHVAELQPVRFVLIVAERDIGQGDVLRIA